MVLQLPAHDPALIEIHRQCQVQEVAAAERHIRDIPHPPLIQPAGWWRIEEQVRAVAQRVPAVGRAGLKERGWMATSPI